MKLERLAHFPSEPTFLVKWSPDPLQILQSYFAASKAHKLK